MDSKLIEQMFKLEDNHWWFQARRDIVLSLIHRYTRLTERQAECLKICDLGVGTGRLLSELSPFAEVYGIDQSEGALKAARRRGLDNVYKGRLSDQVPFHESTFDIVLLLDVLEHIKDDQAALTKGISLLKENGTMICTVPAYRILWSTHDTDHGHQRRYLKRQFRQLFNEAGAEPLLLSYFNFFLFLLAVIQRLSEKLLPRSAGEKNQFVKTPCAPLNLILKRIFAAERFVLPFSSLPFGLSLVAVVRKKNSRFHDLV